MRIAGVAMVCLLLMAGPGQAQTVAVPDTMNYQATLLDAAGAIVPTGSYDIEIRFFSEADSGVQGDTLIWGPQLFDGTVTFGHSPLVQVIDGAFSIVLGPVDTFTDGTFPAGRPLPDAFLQPRRWLEITVVTVLAGQGGPTTFAPRQRMLSAPYAMRAKDAETLGNQTLQVIADDVVMISDPDTPTLRLENSDTGTAGNASIIQFTEGGSVKGQVGYFSPVSTDFLVQNTFNGGKLVLRSDGPLHWNLGIPTYPAHFGNWVMGDLGLGSDLSALSQRLHASITNYALLQTVVGDTILNAAPGRSLWLRMGNVSKVELTDSLFRVLGSARINGNLTIDGSLNIGQISNDLIVSGSGTAGDLKLGNIGIGTGAGLAHVSVSNSTDYALVQFGNGNTRLNAKLGSFLEFRLGNQTRGSFFGSGGVNWAGRDPGSGVFDVRGDLRISAWGNGSRNWRIVADNVSPSNLLFFSSATLKGYLSANGTWVNNSDRKLKTEIQVLGNALEKSLKLKPVTYRFKDTPDFPRRSIGFIAQDVLEVVPEVVSEMGDLLGLNYNGFAVLAIGAIQELNEKFLAEQKKNEDLQDRLEQLEAIVAGLTN